MDLASEIETLKIKKSRLQEEIAENHPFVTELEQQHELLLAQLRSLQSEDLYLSSSMQETDRKEQEEDHPAFMSTVQLREDAKQLKQQLQLQKSQKRDIERELEGSDAVEDIERKMGLLLDSYLAMIQWTVVHNANKP